MLRKLFVFFAIVSTALTTLAQNPVIRNLSPFTKIEAGDRIIVRLVKSDKESAAIQVQGIDASAVKTDVKDGVLQLSVYGEPFTKKKVMVTVNFKTLTSITSTGGADISTTGLFKAPELNVDLKSGGMLYIDADLGKLTGKLVEGSLLTAEGYADNMDISVSTTATLSAFELECEKVTVRAGTGGKAKINVESELNAEATSKGYISYKGNPQKINKNAQSGGTITSAQP
ncbi:MAG TPA: head GIN domain-containing protein [Bacteroidales bacterium]|nr:head GIN domain-containing protein [Bacteroidales bacterium]